MKIYEIDSTEYADHYDFEDSDDITDNFLLNVSSKFTPLKQEVVIKCDLKLQNIQALPAGFVIPIINSRYWSTNAYRIVYIPWLFILCSKRQSEKTVTING